MQTITNGRSQGTAPTGATPHGEVVLPRARTDVYRREAVRVAALSLSLSALLELLQFSTLMVIGEPYGRAELIRDLVLRVPWAVMICIAFWGGLVFSRGRTAIASLVTLVTAPIASLTAHALAEVGHGYALSAAHVMLVSPYIVAVQKALAYAMLAILVVLLRIRTRATAWHHAMAGLLVGVAFGGALLALELETAMYPVTRSDLVALGVNEVLFPVGCALILFGSPEPLLEVRTGSNMGD